MGGAVAPGALELQHDLACWIAFEPFIGNGRAGARSAGVDQLSTLNCTQRGEALVAAGELAAVLQSPSRFAWDSMRCKVMRAR
jgi:hypothetical protein